MAEEEVADLKSKRDELEKRLQDLQREVWRLQDEVLRQRSQPVPEHVHMALAVYLYTELAAGRVPRGLLADQVSYGFSLKTGPPRQERVPAAEADPREFIRWARQNPLSSVSQVFVPRPQQG